MICRILQHRAESRWQEAAQRLCDSGKQMEKLHPTGTDAGGYYDGRHNWEYSMSAQPGDVSDPDDGLFAIGPSAAP